MANTSPQEPIKFVPPPVPDMELDEDLMGDMEGGRRLANPPTKLHLRAWEVILDLFGRGQRTKP